MGSRPSFFSPCFPRRSGDHIFTRSRPRNSGKQKVEESAHLCRRQVARRMICVEWVALLRPVRQDLDKLAASEQRLKAKLDSLCDTVPGRTGRELGSEVIE